MKTVVGNLFAVSALTAFIATSAPAVSALSVSTPNVARHLGHAHVVQGKRKMTRQGCKPRTPPSPEHSGNNNNGGSTTNDGTTNNGEGTTYNGGTTNNGGGTYNGDTTTNNGGSTTNNGGITNNGGTTNNGGSGGYSGGGGGGGGSPLFPGKKGLAFPNGCNELTKWEPNNKVFWHYNWRATPYGNCPGGLPIYVPMLWGYPQVGDFKAATQNNPPAVAFSYNEPNLCGNGDLSACMTPEGAAQVWWDALEPLKSRGTKIGSACTTNAPDGLDWEKNFRKALGGRRTDFLCLHYYDISVEGFLAYVDTWHKTFPDEGMVFTEIGCQNFNGGAQCGYDQIRDFIVRITQWCQSTDYCWGITFFGAMLDMVNVNTLNQLMNTDYSPNDMGRAYLNA